MTCIVMYFIISFISYAHSCTIILLPKIEIYLNFKKQFFPLYIFMSMSNIQSLQWAGLCQCPPLLSSAPCCKDNRLNQVCFAQEELIKRLDISIGLDIKEPFAVACQMHLLTDKLLRHFYPISYFLYILSSYTSWKLQSKSLKQVATKRYFL